MLSNTIVSQSNQPNDDDDDGCERRKRFGEKESREIVKKIDKQK